MRGSRGLALRAEVVELPAQARAEELLPEPVHDRAGGERVVARDEPPGQVEPRQVAPGDLRPGE